MANYFDDGAHPEFQEDFKPGYTIQQIGIYMKDLGDKINIAIQQSYIKSKTSSDEVKSAERYVKELLARKLLDLMGNLML